jgi:hypothetical protein
VSFKELTEAVLFTDGQFNAIEYAQILKVHQILAEDFDISINGSFGGIARGLWWEILFPRIGAYSKLDARKLASRRYVVQRSTQALFDPEIRLDFVSHFTAVIETVNAGLSGLPNTLQMDNANLFLRIHRWQGRIASSTNRLWPCLSPFGLRSVLKAVLESRTHLRLHGLLVRRMLAEFQPSLSKFPLDRGYPAQPVTWRTLPSFYPVFGYYGNRMTAKMKSVLSKSSTSIGHPSEYKPLHHKLYREGQVMELLDSTKMDLRCMFDTGALKAFLERSQRQDFPHFDLWSRLLSLEYGMHVLKKVKPGRAVFSNGSSQSKRNEI